MKLKFYPSSKRNKQTKKANNFIFIQRRHTQPRIQAKESVVKTKTTNKSGVRTNTDGIQEGKAGAADRKEGKNQFNYK